MFGIESYRYWRKNYLILSFINSVTSTQMEVFKMGIAPDFTDLILLIGTNPLPNYVVASHFLNVNPNLERVWLIYSETNHLIGQQGTKNVADNLTRVLTNKYQNQQEPWIHGVPIKHAGLADQIQADVDRYILRHLPQKAKVHLNYTGGTKAMAVHVYRALESDRRDATFSYLDARNHRLVQDDVQYPITKDLRQEVTISLSDLVTIHDLSESPNKKSKPGEQVMEMLSEEQQRALFSGLISLANFSYAETGKKKKSQRNGLDLYRKWVETPPGNDPWDDAIKDKSVIPDTKTRFEREFAGNPHVAALLAMLNPSVVDPAITKDVQPLINTISNPEQWKSFINGFWLEAYVFQVISQSLVHKPALRDKVQMRMNLYATKTGSKPLELDILVIYGYQICNISCSISGTTRLKNRAFEAIHRAHQLGGDEAKSVLVTCLDDTKGFSDDLGFISGSLGSELLVLGRRDLPADRLWSKLETHIFN